MKRNVWLAAASLIGLVTLTACGSSGGSKSDSGADTTSTTKSAETSSTTAAGAEDTLQLVDTSLGKVIAGADGKVLYLYKPDGTAEVSTVPAGILGAWPPVVVKTAPTVGTGLDQSLVSAGAQPNGMKWVRYNDHLLYGFTGDAAPGDINGNGVGGIWYAVTAAGDAVAS
jgi:predicted lipoprotein with Yx(FWY)xxD motif